MPRKLHAVSSPTVAPVVSIVLPTYNERDNIAPLIRRLDQLIEAPFEVLVVDDASPDGTAAVVEALSDELPHARVIRRSDRGLTGAIQRGIDESRGAVIIWMDCDFSMPPELVPELIARVRDDEVDAAIGSRFVPGSSIDRDPSDTRIVRVHRFLARRLNRMISARLGGAFHDWTSGFIAIRASIIKPIRLRGRYGEYFIDLMARLIGSRTRFVEVPFRSAPREHGESKTATSFLGLSRLGIRYIRAFWAARRTLRRP